MRAKRKIQTKSAVELLQCAGLMQIALNRVPVKGSRTLRKAVSDLKEALDGVIDTLLSGRYKRADIEQSLTEIGAAVVLLAEA
jgi:hypothetical protein